MELMDLIQRSQAGDQEAFAVLYDRYKNLVYKTAYLMLGNAHEAEDALQEVFIQVFRALASYQPNRGAFTTWLHRITVNHCLNRKRKRSLPGFPIELAVTKPEALQSSPEAFLTEEQALHQGIYRLSAKLRAVIVLRYYHDLSYAEMAQILEVPLGTVKSRLGLALRTLRKELGRDRADFQPDREVYDEM